MCIDGGFLGGDWIYVYTRIEVSRLSSEPKGDYQHPQSYPTRSPHPTQAPSKWSVLVSSMWTVLQHLEP